MSSSTMSILGLYQYGQYNNDDLFENMQIPEGIDKDDLITNILEQGAAFEVLYPDYDYLKFSIGAWSKRWYRTMDKWITALNIEYDPLNNYDRHEEWTDEDNVSGSTETSATSGGTAEDELSVVAYNSDTYHNKEKKESESSSSSSGSSETTTEGTSEHTGHLYGNIGVTTSQEMLTQELDVQRFNLIQQITDLFLTEYCIMVY